MEDFEPLLPPGIHDTTLDALEQIVIIPFSERDYRQILVERLCSFIQLLIETGLHGEIWINGSFVTKKPRPNDVDLVVIPNGEINTLSDDQRETIHQIFSSQRQQMQIRYSCDIYMAPDDFHKKSYWRGVFGFSRGEKPKGFLRVRI